MKTKEEEKDKRIRNKLRKMKTKLERLDYEVHKIIGVIYNILESLEEKDE